MPDRARPGQPDGADPAPGVVERGGAAVVRRVGELVRELRAGGVAVGTGEVLTAHRALASVEASSREDARLALRAALCARHDDLAVFDAAFERCFAAPAAPLEPPIPPEAALALPRVGDPGWGEEPPEAQVGEPDPVPAAYSAIELLRQKDFAAYSDAERALARRLMANLAVRGPTRLSRRTRAARRRGEIHDLRRTLRASLAYEGEPMRRRWRTPTRRPRPLVLVCDVSGSMEPYARMLLQYLHLAVVARRRVEAFVFGTRLTRVTRELTGRDHDRAIARASAAVTDWAGGTRIGEALGELNRTHGRRLGRGATVVVLSDGWDRGEPEVLAAEMARLRRSAHRLIWLNPLAAHPDYEPLTRGMRAALPHADQLLPGNSIASLEELADLLETDTPPQHLRR